MADALVIAPLVGLAATFLLLAVFLRWPALLSIRDVPNERSLHTKTTPRIGGIALTAGVVLSLMFLEHKVSLVVALPAAILVVISLIDDVRGLAAKWRLLCHLCAATIFVFSELQLSLLFAISFVLAIVWMINLYNFMDGVDGLAGGMAMIGFSVYGVGAFLAHFTDLAVVSFSIACSASAFLLYNFHPAKIFLGDVGSILLGFAAGSLGLLGWNRSIWPLWFPLLVFSPFIIDATLTLLKRFSRRERVWEGHREHYYQRLVRMGWGHSKTALVEYGLMACVGSSALIALRWSPSMQVVLLVGWAFVYLGIAFSIDRAWRRYQAIQTNAD
jgi:UDP-N-acetylmuramyl pentapeptide phosphotransferase/UDP-N-acetylglucosamine-1-phosphate transferase